MGLFDDVRAAFKDAPLERLKLLGVNTKQKANQGQWITVECPVCPDTSGSAGVHSESGYLRCHQCGAKRDLFEWWKDHKGHETDFHSCKDLAATFGVKHEVERKRGRPPKNMTPGVLEAAIENLWSKAEAAPCRKFLEQRRLDVPTMMADMGVGWLGGKITFAQWDHQGELKGRYRLYDPGAGAKHKWIWTSGDGAAAAFWPSPRRLPKDGVIWVMEGEWDVLTAWTRLRLQDKGIFCFTWTGGAGGRMNASQIPECWQGREVHLLYDLDVFQGPDWDQHIAPSQLKKLEMQKRRDAVIKSVVPAFETNRCAVTLHAIPLDPRENFKADFRDWVDAGNDDISKIPGWESHLVRMPEAPPEDCEFKEVFGKAGTRVRFTCQMQTFEDELVRVPTMSSIECDMGNRPECRRCHAPELFPNQVIDWSDWPRKQAQALCSKDYELHVMKHVVGRPQSCVMSEVVDEEYYDGARWGAGHSSRNMEGSQRTLIVISRQEPSMSGDLEVVGTVYQTGKGVCVLAESVRSLDRTDFDVSSSAPDLLARTPSKTNELERIDEFIAARAEDISQNITNIYGREDIHVAMDLVMHSPLWIKPHGKKIRGWLDVCILGDTRTGKSTTCQRYIEAVELGQRVTCMENFSRAGLIMGAMGKDSSKMKPGLLPRNNKKMLLLDEFHMMAEAKTGNESVVRHMQNARDQGVVTGVKVYGHHNLPAAVRLITVGNWIRGSKQRFSYPCQHVMAAYDVPEAVGRLDFALAVHMDSEDPGTLFEAPQWTPGLLRDSVLRAWNMGPDDVVFEPEAIELAEQYCEEWGRTYHTDLPLFTGLEKHLSLLRVASSLANILCSHPDSEFERCMVRKVHVEWAANWMEHTYQSVEYDSYSKQRFRTETIHKPWFVEQLLIHKPFLIDAEDAVHMLESLLETNTANNLGVLMGLDSIEANSAIGKLMHLGVMEKSRSTKNHHYMELTPTVGGRKFIKNLLVIAKEFPHVWAARFRKLQPFFMGAEVHEPRGIVPMNAGRSQVMDYCRSIQEPDNVKRMM